MKDCKIITKCLLCDSDTKLILSLGKSPLANEFLSEPVEQDKFPLNLIQCLDCGHVQLDALVSEERMYRHYLYVSGTSPVNVKHFQDYANDILDRFFTKPTKLPCSAAFARQESFDKDSKGLIIDIGSNDGTFLKNFTTIKKLGVDPATNIAKQANANGIPTLNEFWNEQTVKEKVIPYIKEKYDTNCANIITCNHCFAHNADIKTIVEGVKLVLSDNGTFIFENSYLLDVAEKGIFDVIYSEHIHYYYLKPLIKFFDNLGMRVYNAERYEAQHGGSIRVFVCRKSANFLRTKSLQQLLEKEELINEKLIAFKDKINNLKLQILETLNKIKSDNKSIAIYGAPAKSTTMLHTFNIGKDFFDECFEDNQLKCGLFIPNKKIPIVHSNELKNRNYDYIFINSWNFEKSIIKNHPEHKGKWIVPMPEMKII